MASYLCMKYNNGTTKYASATKTPTKPYLKINNSSFPLTQQTLNGPQLKVKYNNQTYRVVETYQTTTQITQFYTNNKSVLSVGTESRPSNNFVHEIYPLQHIGVTLGETWSVPFATTTATMRQASIYLFTALDYDINNGYYRIPVYSTRGTRLITENKTYKPTDIIRPIVQENHGSLTISFYTTTNYDPYIRETVLTFNGMSSCQINLVSTRSIKVTCKQPMQPANDPLVFRPFNESHTIASVIEPNSKIASITYHNYAVDSISPHDSNLSMTGSFEYPNLAAFKARGFATASVMYNEWKLTSSCSFLTSEDVYNLLTVNTTLTR